MKVEFGTAPNPFVVEFDFFLFFNYIAIGFVSLTLAETDCKWNESIVYIESEISFSSL